VGSYIAAIVSHIADKAQAFSSGLPVTTF